MSDTSLRVPRGMKKAVVLFCLPNEGRVLTVEGPNPSKKLRDAIEAAWDAFDASYLAKGDAGEGGLTES
jgi:hypothetical protein